ncbi:MAG: metallophosphoesterase [Spirochaetales bacterium]|nr:metallophosphoesterase [Spirochaetales bacterium]
MKLKKRIKKNIKGFCLISIIILLFLSACSKKYAAEDYASVSVPDGEKIFSFGLIADCQYCDKPGNIFKNRYYSGAKEKLRYCTETLNSMNLEFTINLGDLIDRDYKSYDEILPVFNSLNMPYYHILGNHDYSVADDEKSTVPERLGMPGRFYDFSNNGWRFIFLDGNEISFFAWPKDSREYEIAKHYYEENKIDSPDWNGAIGQEQLKWLRERLDIAVASKEKVIVFCHYPVVPAGNKHNLWNADELVSIMESYECVKAYINGHDHRGGYEFQNGVHYLTVPGMVETKNENAYAVIDLYKNAIVVDGYGRCSGRILTYQDFE